MVIVEAPTSTRKLGPDLGVDYLLDVLDVSILYKFSVFEYGNVKTIIHVLACLIVLETDTYFVAIFDK